MKQYFQYPTSKYPIKKTLLICLFLTLFAGKALAVRTFTWKGTSGTDWTNANNWTKTGNGNPNNNYPGQTGTTDIVQIGTTPYSGAGISQPTLSTSVTVASISFGDNGGNTMTLTVNGVTLNTGAIKFAHNDATGGITTTITDGATPGTLICTSLTLGDTDNTPSANGNFSTTLNCSLTTLNIGGTLTLNSTSAANNRTNNPEFDLISGNLIVNSITTNDDRFRTGNTCKFNMDIGNSVNTLTLNAQNPFSSLAQGTTISFVSGGTIGASTVIYNYASNNRSQTIYTSDDDGFNTTSPMYPNLIFQNTSDKDPDGGTLSVGGDWTTGGGALDLSDNHPAVIVAGNWNNTTAITYGSGAITVNGNLNNNTGSAINESTGAINITGDLNNGGTIKGNTATNGTVGATTIGGTTTNTGTITVSSRETMTFTGAFTNTGTYTGGTTTTSTSTFNGSFTNNTGHTFSVGSANVNFNGDYINSGTFTGSTTANIIFGGAGDQALADNSSSGTSLVNLLIQGGGTKTMSGSKGFVLPVTGELTMGGTATLDCGGAFTLQSDASGSAIVDALPTGTAIKGNANVERFMEGSAATNRGYRLMSSTVFTGTPTVGTNVFDFNYLTTSNLWVSGPGYAANGFNVTTTENPSIYLFREDVAPPQSKTVVFTTGYNWKGVAKINNSPLYNIGTQAKTTTANINDFTTTIPVGNGFLLFDRGTNSTTTGRTVGPFGAPGNVTLTAVGQLNTGNITVKPWYNTTASFTFTTSSTTMGTNILARGYALVGNPYPATINWEKYNNSHAANALTGTLVTTTIWEYNPTTKQFGTYKAINNTNVTGENFAGSTHTNGGTNFIASGMGFFVQATAAGQTLTFTEASKVTTNGLATTLNDLMGKPKETIVQPAPYVRLKLITDSVNNDDILISFDSKASSKYIVNEDAEDLGGNGAPESLSSFSSDSLALAVNSLPFPGKQPQLIRLLTDAVTSGSYSLTVPELGNIPQLYMMWLKDAFTGDSVQLKLNTSYSFTIDKSNAATFGDSRFTVVIRQDSAFAYKLLDFTATKVDHQSDVELVWKTANEENYTRFTVERSTDNGKTFNVVGGMLGTGAGNYSLVDKNPDNGRNLYRLKQEDINDSITYSKVIDVQFGNIFSKLHIFPNPATHTINLAIAQGEYYGGSYSIKFMNSAGRVVKEVQSSQPEWQGNISYLMPGTYLVKVVNTRTQNLVGENKFVKL